MVAQKERDALKVLRSCVTKVKKMESDVTAAVQRTEELRPREIRELKEAIRRVDEVLDRTIDELEGRGSVNAATQFTPSVSSPVKE